MKFNAPLLALIGVMAAAPIFAAEQTVTFSVPGMYCASCPFIVEAAMTGVDGVRSVTADSETRTALVVFDDEVATLQAIGAASAAAGYEATPVDCGS